MVRMGCNRQTPVFSLLQNAPSVTKPLSEATGRPITVVAVGAESIPLANDIAASVKELVPSLESVVLRSSEEGVHDLLWQLGPSVQFLIVVWPEDVSARTCGINAITASSDGLLCLLFYIMCQRCDSNGCCFLFLLFLTGFKQVHADEVPQFILQTCSPAM